MSRSKTVKKTRRVKRDYWHKQFQLVHTGIFDSQVGIAVNMTEAEVKKQLVKLNPKRRDEFEEVIKDWDDRDPNVNGLCIRLPGGGFVVFLALEKDTFRTAMGLIVHEINHVVTFLLNGAGVPLSPDTHEVYAYLNQRIVHQTLLELWD